MNGLVALMPLRGGSKSIPGKNIKPMAGRPLCAWALGEAIAANIFDEIYVSTDAPDIKSCVLETFGDAVTVLDRPASLAQDETSTEAVMTHFADSHSFETLCLIQATSPLTTRDDFTGAWQQFQKTKADSLVTASVCKRFFWQPDGIPVNYNPATRPRRQDFAGSLMENGAFYFTRREILAKHQCRLGGKIEVFQMNEETSVEIDEQADWEYVTILLRQRAFAAERFAKVKAIVVDVDGTLTDGGMYYGSDGERLKKFDTRDAQGLALVRTAGIEVGVITAEDSASVTARMEKLGIDLYYKGIKDKIAACRDFCAKTNLSLDEVLYVGDDVGDADLMAVVGLTACPSDAQEKIKNLADYVASLPGGAGAVRDICNRVLEARS